VKERFEVLSMTAVYYLEQEEEVTEEVVSVVVKARVWVSHLRLSCVRYQS
jgi:hypothetical protein